MVTNIKNQTVITIDGPAASGKSSVARGVADALNIPFVSSGLLYRAATYLTLLAKRNAHCATEILDLLAEHDVQLEALAIEPNRVIIDNEDITAALHTDDVDANVSAVAKHPQIRRWVDERLRDIKGKFVVEGRDMGTAVFPKAAYKFYLTASPEVRAKRRVGEREHNLQEISEALMRRDELDKKQLAPASDAVAIDTSDMNLEDVIHSILSKVEFR